MGSVAKQPDGKPEGVVLIADDERMICELASAALRLDGYVTLTACDGQDAVEISEQHSGPIDLFITDVRMPLMDGNQAVARITAQRIGIKVLLMSGYPLPENDAKTFSFLPKPFTASDLCDKVKELLSKKTN